jgi:uncharacterized membrane protein
MSDDLYAPPRADLGAHGPPLLGTGDFDIARCFSEAWANTWENFPLWLGAGIVFVLASVGSVITILGILLALPVLAWGGFRFFLRMHDGGARVGDLFAGFSRYGSTLGPMLGFYLLTMLIGLPANAVVQIGARSSPPNLLVVVAGYLASLAIALFVTSRLTFAAFLIVDRDMRLGEALSEAWSRTAPLAWKVALLMLAMVAVLFVGLLAFCVGVIPASVVGYMMWVSAYRQIFGGASQPAA